MPITQVIYFQNRDGKAPVRDWLSELKAQDVEAFAKCVARIGLLQASGHELRRPIADILTEGIYELRASKGRVNYRILYFFHGRNVAILANACTKEGEVPTVEIATALERKIAFLADPEKHTYSEK